jgi:hypothetical protein
MKRENVKYVEVLSVQGDWRKRIHIETFKDGACLCVTSGSEEMYIDNIGYLTHRWGPDQWREIKEPEYVPYESVEDFKDRLADGLVLAKKGFYPQRIVSTGSNCVWVAKRDETEEIYFDSLFECYTWYSDGAPCGKIKER